jgi:Putative prokaryotic signal transducing protein
LKRIFSSWNLTVVHHYRNVLEAEGIRAVVKNQYLSSAMGDLPPTECQAELWVLSEADAPRAERLLHRGPPQGPEWTCASCGERLAPQFTQCWRCGSDRPV